MVVQVPTEAEVDRLVRATRTRRRELDRLAGEARVVAARGKALQVEVADLAAQVSLYEKVGAVLTSIGETRQVAAQHQIEMLVTRGLQVIFSEELSFHVVAKVAGKTAQVDFIVRSTLPSGKVIDTPVMEARGGGLAATVGFLLRLVVLLLSDRRDSTLFLDETFSMVSAEYLDRVSAFLREIVDRTGIQIIMVTHQPVLAENADKIYRFALDAEGVTVVSEQ